MKKKFLIFILVLLMTLVFIPSIASAANTTDFAGGSGTSGDPYLISTKAQLNNVRNDLDAHYKLTCDIEFTDADFAEGGAFYNNGAGWKPIGKFTGSFDGKNHTISNLKIDTTTDQVGLFSEVSNGTVKNINLRNVSISGRKYVGGICGYLKSSGKNNSSEVKNCYVDGEVSATQYAGGICGYAYGLDYSRSINNEYAHADTRITSCFNNANVSAYDHAGGITSSTYSAGCTISKCVNNGTVTSGGVAGGILAYLSGDNSNSWSRVGLSVGTTYYYYYYYYSKVENCYNTGTIDGITSGGIVGASVDNDGTYNGVYNGVINCYNVGSVSGSTVDAIIAQKAKTPVKSCYSISSNTDEELKKISTYQNWDFDTIWTLGGDFEYQYPELQCFTLSGTLGIKGDVAYMSVVEPDLSGVNKVDETFTYEWLINGEVVADTESYTLQVSDIGQTLQLKVTGTKIDNQGSLYSAEITVGKGIQPIQPIAPIVTEITNNAVTLEDIPGYEYSKNGTSWQSSATFTGLSPNTTYTFYQRIKETGIYCPSASSAGVSAVTLKNTVSQPAKPTLSAKTDTTVTLVKISGYEYSKNGTTWQTSNVFTGLSPDTTYTFYQRVKETSTAYASEMSKGLEVTTYKVCQINPNLHVFDNSCDTTCNECGAKRTIKHTYDNACDTDCNVCGETRTIKHTYSNACDETCNVCGDYRIVGEHEYNNDCDTTCNECGETRPITHAYKTTTTKATASSNGSIVKKCTVCGKVASSTTIKYAKTFTLSATTYTYDGKTKAPTVTVKDSSGATLTKNTDYTVTYASGRVNVGSYTVTVKGIGNYSFTKTLTFKINAASLGTCKLSATSYTYNGSVKTPSVTVKNASGTTLTKGTSYTVTYASGRKNAGTYTVTIKGIGNYSGTKTLTFKINPVSLGTCKLSATSYTYNGSVKTPTVTVKSASGSTLTKGTSYTVTYASGRKNVGTYTVTVKGIGNYTGTKTLTFKINPASLGTCKLSATSYTYNGSVKTPSVTVKNASGTTLTKGSSYTVTYASGRKNVGTYKVTIKGIGNYTGTKTLSFKINPAKAANCSMKLSATSYTYNGSVKTPTVTVMSPSGSTLTKGSSYTVTYASGRKGVGTYTVKVTMKGNYTGTKTLTFTITPAAKTSVNLLIGETTSAGAKSNKAITYSSSNSSVATVNAKGVITAKKAGTATITVKSNGITRKISVTVTSPYVKVSGTNSMVLKNSVTLKATTNANATVKWSSSNTKVATVSASGKVTGQKVGTATIYAKITYKGKTYTGRMTVTVQAPTLYLDTYSTTIYVGETYTLKATTNTGVTVKFKSSNTSVATVSSSGRITPKSTGSATITAYFSYAGTTYSRTCSVTVKKSNFRLVKNYILANGYTDSNGYKYIGMYDTSSSGTRYNFAITYNSSRNSLVFESWSGNDITMQFEYKENQSYIDVEMYITISSYSKASITYTLDVDTYNNDSGFTYYIRTQGYLSASSYKDLIGAYNDLAFSGWNLVLQYKIGITLNDLGFTNFYS